MKPIAIVLMLAALMIPAEAKKKGNNKQRQKQIEKEKKEEKEKREAKDKKRAAVQAPGSIGQSQFPLDGSGHLLREGLGTVPAEMDVLGQLEIWQPWLAESVEVVHPDSAGVHDFERDAVIAIRSGGIAQRTARPGCHRRRGGENQLGTGRFQPGDDFSEVFGILLDRRLDRIIRIVGILAAIVDVFHVVQAPVEMDDFPFPSRQPLVDSSEAGGRPGAVDRRFSIRGERAENVRLARQQRPSPP